MPTYYDSSLDHRKGKAKMYDQRGRWRCVCRVHMLFWKITFFLREGGNGFRFFGEAVLLLDHVAIEGGIPCGCL